MISKFRNKNMLNTDKPRTVKKDKIKELSYRISVSLISEFLKDNGMNYTRSVFLPETEFESDVLSRQELFELLSIRNPRVASNDANYSILESIIDKVFAREIMGPKTFNMQT